MDFMQSMVSRAPSREPMRGFNLQYTSGCLEVAELRKIMKNANPVAGLVVVLHSVNLT